MLKVIVCGGRNYSDVTHVHAVLEGLAIKPDLIIHGGASGADTLADRWAKVNGIHQAKIEAFSAGPVRNGIMASLGAQLCIAFPGGRGTADMVRQARDANIQVWEV